MSNRLPIDKNDFCVVSTRKKIAGSTLSLGDVVLVIAMQMAQAKASDPYLRRVYALIVKVEDGVVLIPKDENEYKAILMDPKNLTRLSDEDQEKYNNLLKKQYGEEINEATD